MRIMASVKTMANMPECAPLLQHLLTQRTDVIHTQERLYEVFPDMPRKKIGLAMRMMFEFGVATRAGQSKVGAPWDYTINAKGLRRAVLLRLWQKGGHYCCTRCGYVLPPESLSVEPKRMSCQPCYEAADIKARQHQKNYHLAAKEASANFRDRLNKASKAYKHAELFSGLAAENMSADDLENRDMGAIGRMSWYA